jgi:hypothetical protein
MTIYYEDLLQNPNESMQKILNFCELDFPKSIKDLMPPVKTDTQEKWVKTLSKLDLEQISTILGPSLEKINYPYDLT